MSRIAPLLLALACTACATSYQEHDAQAAVQLQAGQTKTQITDLVGLPDAVHKMAADGGIAEIWQYFEGPTHRQVFVPVPLDVKGPVLEGALVTVDVPQGRVLWLQLNFDQSGRLVSYSGKE